jgi:hypothetical protein
MGRRSKRDSRASVAEARQSASPPPGPPSRDEEWVRSMSTKERIISLMWDGVMLDAATEGWRPAVGEEFLMTKTHEAVVFESAYLRDFGLPTYPSSAVWIGLLVAQASVFPV